VATANNRHRKAARTLSSTHGSASVALDRPTEAQAQKLARVDGSGVKFALTFPEIVWEASLGIYLTVKGFRSPPGFFDETPRAAVHNDAPVPAVSAQ
jgi:hypothetical protein